MLQVASIILTALASFLACLLVGPFTIKLLRRLKFGQSIRDDGPQTHLKKAGTPTMGGVIILFAIMVGLLVTRPFTPQILGLLFLVLGFGLVGLIDDLIIIITKKSLGLKARQKLLAQFIVAGIVMFYFVWRLKIPTAQLAPFFNLNLIFMPGLAGEILFFLFGIIYIAGFSNAVNFTDGLDGLAGGTTAIAAITLGALSLYRGQFELAVFSFAIGGACFGFVWFNGPPAQVFMGDTGSLALGAGLAGIAILSQYTLVLPVIGGIFVAELFSVIIQVASYKTTRKRVFRMSPVHHHFELGGMVESQIMIRFWIVGLILGALGVLGVIGAL
ncbi:MAG: phospho-N-acetylmuramoyl-pentapeptide-transferase [Firmicutes bacterium]|nr:phospho-N-acetylmuramoyl-pentapeptide-transferase [Bacillota bacterium]